jgi:hypothetical protein
MSTKTPDPPPDPLAALQMLDACTIRGRLDELDREARSLRVLLRYARARERGQERSEQPPARDAAG